MRGIGGNVGEKGFVLRAAFLDPSESSGEEKIGTVALGFHEGAIVSNDRVEVFVSGNIGAGAAVALSDPAGPVYEGLIKSPLVRLVGIFIAKMPFPENARGVSRLLQNLR